MAFIQRSTSTKHHFNCRCSSIVETLEKIIGIDIVIWLLCVCVFLNWKMIGLKKGTILGWEVARFASHTKYQRLSSVAKYYWWCAMDECTHVATWYLCFWGAWTCFFEIYIYYFVCFKSSFPSFLSINRQLDVNLFE